MSRLDCLADKLAEHLSLPWRRTTSGAQRVVMVVYDNDMERAVRARMLIFENHVRALNLGWTHVDVTRLFSGWLGAHDYRDAYFEAPEVLQTPLETEFLEYAERRLGEALDAASENDVVALTGVGSLYGLVRISTLVQRVERRIRGRLVVFFPGQKDGNNYRLLDARDGWNYLAVGITLEGCGDRA